MARLCKLISRHWNQQKKGSEEEYIASNMLGQFYDDIDAPLLAVKLFQDAQNLALKIFGADSVQIALALGNESMCYNNRKNLRQGSPLLDNAIRILLSQKLKDFKALPDYMIEAPISLLSSAASLKILMDKKDEAIEIGRHAYELAKQLLPVLSPTYIQAGFGYCSILSYAGKEKEKEIVEDKIMTTLLQAGCHPAELMQLMKAALGDLIGDTIFEEVDLGGLDRLQDAFAHGGVTKNKKAPSNVVPFKSAAANKSGPANKKSPAAESEVIGYQLKITLKNVKPPVWRRITATADMTLAALHHDLQDAMGWTNSHLHEFEIGGRRFSKKDPEIDALDERRYYLSDFKLKVGSKFSYMYDFGDGWDHTIVVEKLLSEAQLEDTAIFIKAQGGCPPEDCGGPWGYMHLREVMKNGGPEKEDLEDWLDGRDLDALPLCFEEEEQKKAAAKTSKVKNKIKNTPGNARAKGKVKAKPDAAKVRQVQAEKDAAKKSGLVKWPGT